jgi:hypothetical protein
MTSGGRKGNRDQVSWKAYTRRWCICQTNFLRVPFQVVRENVETYRAESYPLRHLVGGQRILGLTFRGSSWARARYARLSSHAVSRRAQSQRRELSPRGRLSTTSCFQYDGGSHTARSHSTPTFLTLHFDLFVKSLLAASFCPLDTGIFGPQLR